MMNNQPTLKPLTNELREDFIKRLCENKDTYGITYQDIADILYDCFGFKRSEAYYRRVSKGVVQLATVEKIEETGTAEDGIKALLNKITQERMKLNDQLTENRALVRRLSREDTFKEIALSAVSEIAKLKVISHNPRGALLSEKSGVLLISDWHYGDSFSILNNEFSPDIAKERIKQLYDRVCHYISKEKLSELYVLNLGDMIAGRIHLRIRLQSRVDAVTQTMEVAEIMSEFINNLSERLPVYYCDCTDNHSRVEPNKKESLDVEAFSRFIPWYMKSRLSSAIESGWLTFLDNEYDEDIISVTCRGHRIGAVHGDDDKVGSVVPNITLLTKDKYDMICMAHNHHFVGDERNEVLVIGNGSLMGSDPYAKNHRHSAVPSQTLITVTDDNIAESIHRIILR